MPVRFCADCQNMLYPKENTAARRQTGERQLTYACKSCLKVQVIEHPKEAVHRNVIVHTAEEKLAITYDVALDPTLPRTYEAKCPNPECGNSEAVYFQSPVGKNDEALILVFVCVACNQTWLSNEQ